MDGFPRKLARCVAVLAAGVAPGSACPETLGAIPEAAIETFLEEEELERWEPRDRRNLMWLLSQDEREGVRRSLLKQVSRCPVPIADPDEDWLVSLASDPSPDLREAFAFELRTLIERSSVIDRTYLVSSWAVSPVAEVRLSIARALDSSFEAVGARVALQHLLTDPATEVREAAHEAARRRGVVG